MRLHRLVVALGIALATFSVVSLFDPGLCFAQRTSRSPGSVDSIRRFMEKGQALFASGQYVKAAEVFDAGFEMHPYSAFLFNAGVALEKAERYDEALVRFRKYIEVDATAPDRAEVQKRISAIEDRLAKPASGKPGQPTSPLSSDAATKSLVVVETDPVGAPLGVYRQVEGDAPYDPQGKNPGWHLVMNADAPAQLSLDVGRYYVATNSFQDFNASGAAVEVVAGRVYQVKLSLSQGQFMAFLRITASVPKARVYLDDPKQQRVPWGVTPFGDFVTAGSHSIRVVAVGHSPWEKTVDLARGQQQELTVRLERLKFGSLRLDSNAPSVEVTVDGRTLGSWRTGAPLLEVPNLAAGIHRVRVTSEGRKPVEDEVRIPSGRALVVRAHMVVTPPRGAAWTQAIIGTALLSGGIYMGLKSNQLYDELESDRRDNAMDPDDDRFQRGKLFAVGADIAFAGAGILGGLATYNFLKDPLPPSRLVPRRIVEFDEPLGKVESTRRPGRTTPSASIRDLPVGLPLPGPRAPSTGVF